MRHFLFRSIAVITISIILIIVLFINNSQARPWRPSQIPNGNEFACANCHISAFGGGPRNPFGVDVWDFIVTPGSRDSFWNLALTQKDSDRDSATNGEELQDPNGIFQCGEPSPGNRTLVSNPGDPDSLPRAP